jgi:hypothetical protein
LVSWSVNNQGKITYTDAGCIGPCVAPAVCIEDLEPGQTSYAAWCHCY